MAFHDTIRTLLTTDTNHADNFNEVYQQLLENDLALNGMFSNPNLIIGGDFSTNPWQRGTSFTNIANGVYTADRFQLFAQGNCAVSKEGKWIKTTINNIGVNTQTTTLEIPESLLGKTVTLSFLAKSNINFGSGIYIWNGKLITNAIKVQPIVLTTTEQRFSTTFTIPASLTDNLLYIWFARLEAFVGGTCWISECKLELGSVATPFVPRPYGEELASSRRYFYTQKSVLATPHSMVATTTTTLSGSILFPISMRITPTLTNLTFRSNTNGDVLVATSFQTQGGVDGINAIYNITFATGTFTVGHWYTIIFDAHAEL